MFFNYWIFYWPCGLECSPMARETWTQSYVKSYQRVKKWWLMPPSLTLSIIMYGSRVKWDNFGNGVTPSPTPWCCSYRNRSFQVTLDYGRRLYFYWKFWLPKIFLEPTALMCLLLLGSHPSKYWESSLLLNFSDLLNDLLSKYLTKLFLHFFLH